MKAKSTVSKKRPHSALAAKTNGCDDSESAPPSTKVVKTYALFTRPQRAFTWISTKSPVYHGYYPTPLSPTTSKYERPLPSKKLALFDLDGCVIKPKTKGETFPKSALDWTFFHPIKVQEKIRKCFADGFAIVILSNQGWAQGSNQITWFEAKVPEVALQIGVPLYLFAARGSDDFRKPGTGMFDLYVKDFNGGLDVDFDESFFVGDAAGRPGDHSDSDLKMAAAAGLKLHTPEDFFL